MKVIKQKLEDIGMWPLMGWVIGITLPLVIGFGVFTVQSLSADENRLSVVETKSSDVDARLDRIENKLDGVLTSLRANKNY